MDTYGYVWIRMDTYGENRIKEMSQKSRGSDSKYIRITGKQQKMTAFKDWGYSLCNGENKTNLISFLANYYKKSEIPEKLNIPLIITERINTWKIENEIYVIMMKPNTGVVLHDF